jgi:hypothetical protein
MAKDEKKTITVNDIDYNVEDLSEQQIAMVNHIADLDRKLSSARFNVDQLMVGREAFVDMLTRSLAEKAEEPEVVNG